MPRQAGFELMAAGHFFFCLVMLERPGRASNLRPGPLSIAPEPAAPVAPEPFCTRGARSCLAQQVTDGARSRRIGPCTWRSQDRRNGQDGTAPSDL
jgi:hypothetical protein